jgi:5-amino-6-(5-phospho-D-ribitylamino)uracil phosphatase
MKKPHIIAVDLDGTLLTDEKIITERTKNVLQSLIADGHHIVIATGRPYRASKQYYHELNLKTPIVNFNGAFVHHPKDVSWGTYHSPMKLDTAKAIIETCEAMQVKNVMVEVVDDVYLRNHDDFIVNTFLMGEAKFQIGNLHNLLMHDPTSILVHPFDHHQEEFRNLLEKEHAEIIEHRTWGAPFNVIEITSAGLSKAEGLKKISEHFDVPSDRIIAFGDEDNDFEMIDYAGHGVAMGNAIEQLKNLANHITSTNEEEGIATFLEDYFKLKL